MNYIIREKNAIIFENDGEKRQFEPWGKNSLRVRAIMVHVCTGRV